MSTDCFLPNGTKYDYETIYIPCNVTAVQNGEHSACCASNDLCLTNGMCVNPGDNASGLNYYWRIGCTDSTFEDPVCPKYCIDSKDDQSTNHLIFNCLKSVPTVWACAPSDAVKTLGAFKTDGCDDPISTFSASAPLIYTTARIATIPQSITSSTSSRASSTVSQTIITTASASTPAITTSTSTPSASTQSSPPSGLSLGAKVGLGVGIPFGVGLLALLGVITMLLLRRRNAADALGRNAQGQVKPAVFEMGAPRLAPHYEAVSHREPAELAVTAK